MSCQQAVCVELRDGWMVPKNWRRKHPVGSSVRGGANFNVTVALYTYCSIHQLYARISLTGYAEETQ